MVILSVFSILSLNSSTKNTLLAILITLEMLFSFLTLFIYLKDKKNARRKLKRISDIILLILPWLMGGIGGFLGIYSVRTKMHKWYFPLNNVLALIVQVALIIIIYVLC